MMQEFVQEVTDTVKDTLKGVHTAIPGSIVSFDPGTGLATVLPTMKFKKPDGTTVDFPPGHRVPVVFPQSMGQQATIAYPVKAGGWLPHHRGRAEHRLLALRAGDRYRPRLRSNQLYLHPGSVRKGQPRHGRSLQRERRGGKCEGHEGHGQGRLRPGDAGTITLNGNVTVSGNFTTQGGVVNLN